MLKAPNLLHRDLTTATNERKLRFHREVIRRPLARLVDCPVYITLGLDKRTAPRTCFLLERGIVLPASLPYLTITADKFCKRYNISEEAYAAWVAAWQQTPQGQLWGVKPAHANPDE